VATDYFCVLAGVALGVPFVPLGIGAEFFGGLMDPRAQFSLLHGIVMPIKKGGAYLGLLGKILIPTSLVGLLIGSGAAQRLVTSKRISSSTAFIIQAALCPADGLLD
jgi:hypothetical protein